MTIKINFEWFETLGMFISDVNDKERRKWFRVPVASQSYDE